MRFQLLIDKIESFVKQAGRIPAEKYNKQIFEIIGKIQDFLRSKNHWSIQPGQSKNLGSVNFDVNGNIYTLPIKAIKDPNSPIRAGVEANVGKECLIINLEEFKFQDDTNFSLLETLKPLITHEVTHFLDGLYNPINRYPVNESDVKFFEEFRDLFLQYPSKIRYDDLSSFNGKTIEEIATKNTISFIKTKSFKDLLDKYNKTLNKVLLGQLIKSIQMLYLDDLSHYRDTGGYLHAPANKEEKDDAGNIMHVGRTLYHRSDAEMKTQLNEIITEIQSYLWFTDKNKTSIALIKGTLKVSEVIDLLLSKSETYNHIKDYLTEDNIKAIYTEVSKYLSNNNKARSLDDWEKIAGVTLNSQEKLMFKYIMKLYSSDSDKLMDKMKNKNFVEKYSKSLAVFKAYIENVTSVNKILNSMPKLDSTAALVNKVNNFLKLAAESEELPEDSDDLNTVLKNISNLETFKARVDYAEKNLEHLSSGTSRVVYVVNNGKEVLKLAKNERGIAQNKIESKLKCKYINETTKSDSEGAWKISPFLDKVTEKEFEKLCGANFKEFGEALEYGLQKVSDDSKSKPKGFEKIEKLDIYKELIKIGKKYELMPGDMARISSWGQVDGHPTLLDAGLTKDIYDEFY